MDVQEFGEMLSAGTSNVSDDEVRAALRDAVGLLTRSGDWENDSYLAADLIEVVANKRPSAVGMITADLIEIDVLTRLSWHRVDGVGDEPYLMLELWRTDDLDDLPTWIPTGVKTHMNPKSKGTARENRDDIEAAMRSKYDLRGDTLTGVYEADTESGASLEDHHLSWVLMRDSSL